MQSVNIKIIEPNSTTGNILKKYEIIAHKETQKLVAWIDLFLITDIDKNVSPKERKE